MVEILGGRKLKRLAEAEIMQSLCKKESDEYYKAFNIKEYKEV